MLTLQNVQYGYGLKQVGELKGTLVLPHGETSGITLVRGRNGSGKTTFLKTLACLLPLLSGRILWNNLPIEEVSPSGKICFLGDRLEFHEELSVQAILSSLAASKPKIIRLMQDLGLNAKSPWKHLSTGQRQKVRLALILLRMDSSDLILLDEPFSGLDSESQETVMDLLQNGIRGRNKRLLICLHHETLPSGWIENVLLFDAGSLTMQYP